MDTIARRARSRETIYDKAQRILSDPSRVVTHPKASPPNYWVGEVVGDTGSYEVVAMSPEFAEAAGMPGRRLACRCRAGNRPMLCSHMLVGEEMRLRGEES
jgi:hypothetical protein